MIIVLKTDGDRPTLVVNGIDVTPHIAYSFGRLIRLGALVAHSAARVWREADAASRLCPACLGLAAAARDLGQVGYSKCADCLRKDATPI